MVPVVPALDSRSPLAALYECHRRILGKCATLRQLMVYIVETGCNRQAQVVSHGLLRFFDNEVPQHCADEHEEVFPALIESIAGSDALRLQSLTKASAEQHLALAIQWSALRGPLEEIATGRDTLLSSRHVEAFGRQWREQIGLEEGELLPMASRLLTHRAFARIERAMRDRRS
jgi:hypothetical protein